MGHTGVGWVIQVQIGVCHVGVGGVCPAGVGGSLRGEWVIQGWGSYKGYMG